MSSPRRRVSTGTIAVAFALLALAGVVGWMLVLVRNEPSPIGPEPTATEVAVLPGTPASSPQATPSPVTIRDLPLVTVEQYRGGTLPDLLRYAPDRLADDSLPLSDVAQYANITGWMRARGIETPSGPTDPRFPAWEAELEPLAIPSVLATRGNDDIWVQTYGFRLSDVDQVLAVGQAPDLVLVIRGNFDQDHLQDAWVESGYQAVRREDITLWSLFPGDQVDLSAPASRPALGNMNNVVLLEDGTLLATSRLSRLEQAVRAFHGAGPSLDENPQMAALLAPPVYPYRLDTAVILKGSMLVTDPSTPSVLATPEAKGWVGGATPIVDAASRPVTLPHASLLLAGLEAPPPGEDIAPFSLVLTYGSASDAVQAAIRADRALRMADSPVTGAPYRARIVPKTLQVYASGDGAYTMRLVASLPRGGDDWLAILDERDLGFVMWPWTP